MYVSQINVSSANIPQGPETIKCKGKTCCIDVSGVLLQFKLKTSTNVSNAIRLYVLMSLLSGENCQ